MRLSLGWTCLLSVLLACCACRAPQILPAEAMDVPYRLPPDGPEMPRELAKTTLPVYTIEPPDILTIEAIHIVPRAPYTLRTGDVVDVSVQGTLPDAPILGVYQVQAGGVINLGLPYGPVRVHRLTVEQAQAEIHRALTVHIRNPVVSLSLVETAAKQQIAGQHLVGPDGTVTLGTYGSVPVVGLTLYEAKKCIELHLQQFLDDPEVAVDVFAYNSKVYYVITAGAGTGDTVVKFPITGNETVLDAIANINGLTSVSSKRLWIARAVPESDQIVILPVDWHAIAAQGTAATNYQILPGDRLFVAEDKWVAFDSDLAKVFAPFERIMGFSLLGVNTVTRFSGPVLRGGGQYGRQQAFVVAP